MRARERERARERGRKRQGARRGGGPRRRDGGGLNARGGGPRYPRARALRSAAAPRARVCYDCYECPRREREIGREDLPASSVVREREREREVVCV